MTTEELTNRQTEQLRQLGIVLNRYQDIDDILRSPEPADLKLVRIQMASDELGKALVAAHPHLSGKSTCGGQ